MTAATTVRAASTPVPGAGAHPLLHPLVLGSIAVLVVNDHLLKARWPGLVTGKLSDVAGLVFFPLLLATVGAALTTRVRHHHGPDPDAARPERSLPIGPAVVATGAGFAAVKVLPAVAAAWSLGLGALQWPVRAVATTVLGGALPEIAPVVVRADPWDLVALPALLVAMRVGTRA